MDDLAKNLIDLFNELEEIALPSEEYFILPKEEWVSIKSRLTAITRQIESEDVLNIIKTDKNLQNINKPNTTKTNLIIIDPIDFILKVFYVEKINLNEKNLTFPYIRKILDLVLDILNKHKDIYHIPWTRVYVISTIQSASDILKLEGEDEVRLLLNNKELLKYVDNPVDYDREFNMKLINAIDTARLKISTDIDISKRIKERTS